MCLHCFPPWVSLWLISSRPSEQSLFFHTIIVRVFDTIPTFGESLFPYYHKLGLCTSVLTLITPFTILDSSDACTDDLGQISSSCRGGVFRWLCWLLCHLPITDEETIRQLVGEGVLWYLSRANIHTNGRHVPSGHLEWHVERFRQQHTRCCSFAASQYVEWRADFPRFSRCEH